MLWGCPATDVSGLVEQGEEIANETIFQTLLSDANRELASLLQDVRKVQDDPLLDNCEAGRMKKLLLRAVQCAAKQYMLQAELGNLAPDLPYYEVLVDGKQIDPMKTPPAVPVKLQGAQLAEFQKYVETANAPPRPKAISAARISVFLAMCVLPTSEKSSLAQSKPALIW